MLASDVLPQPFSAFSQLLDQMFVVVLRNQVLERHEESCSFAFERDA